MFNVELEIAQALELTVSAIDGPRSRSRERRTARLAARAPDA
jgi:hypothetical protein